MQKGDVQSTSADTKLLEKMINFKPHTSVEVGLKVCRLVCRFL